MGASVGVAIAPAHATDTGVAAQARRHGDVRRQDLHPPGPAVRPRAGRRQDAQPHPGVGAARPPCSRATLQVHVQPQAAAGTGGRHRRRGARPLGAPGPRLDRARGVHPDRGAQRADRPADHPGPRHRRWPPCATWRAAGHDLAHRGEPLRAQPAGRRPRRRRRPAARPARRPGRPADPGGHRGLGHGRPRPGGRRAARPARARACGCRSTTSAPATRRCPTCSGCRSRRSRSTAASSRPGTGQRERRHRPGHHRPGPQPRPRGRRRGRRGPGDLGPPGHARLRHRAGLAPGPGDADRRPAALAASRARAAGHGGPRWASDPPASGDRRLRRGRRRPGAAPGAARRPRAGRATIPA